jgi:hypothetical protein
MTSGRASALIFVAFSADRKRSDAGSQICADSPVGGLSRITASRRIGRRSAPCRVPAPFPGDA